MREKLIFDPSASFGTSFRYLWHKLPNADLKIENRKSKIVNCVVLCLIFSSSSLAVSSKVIRHNSSSDLLKGRTENVVISSRGTIQLGRATESLIKEFESSDVWSINSIVLSGGTVYFGTSPNGGIYKYSLNKLTKIYPQDADRPRTPKVRKDSIGEQEDTNKSDDEDDAEEYLSNEHIFALATDVAGRLLAGISGRECRLCRLEGEKMETIFEPEPDDVKYIFAIVLDEGGNIYLGTGPEGKIYKLDSLGKKPEMIYDSRDKNILSLAVGRDGCIYAGSDTRGLVYKIYPRTRKVMVLYDSEQPEITALLSAGTSESDACMYAAATSAKIVQTQTQFAATTFGGTSAGRPEAEEKSEESAPQDTLRRGENPGDRKLEIANTQAEKETKAPVRQPPVRKGAKPDQASHIYKITEDGFVTDVFGEAAVFFCLAEYDGNLLVGTGNNAHLYSIDLAAEQQVVIYEDEQAAQITAIVISGKTVYLGTANPAKLLTLGSGFASEGTYTSDLIDAGQPATWGKLQLEASIPQGCKVLLAARSGNVQDVNDPTFSEWSEPVEITEPVQLQCPLGRFCQYKLILQSQYGTDSPLIREIAVASTVPNLAPQIESVTVSRIKGSGKEGVFKIGFKAKDDNDDKLVYKIDFRKLGWTSWIQMKDELEAPSFEWDGKTVEDGRYEIRVTVSDARSNTTLTELTGSRISDPVIVDNTGPVVKDMRITSSLKDNGKYRVLGIEVADELSAIDKLEYTIDSNDRWISTVPDDLVYDTTNEHFTIRINAQEDLPKGDHVVTVRVSDANGNTTYKTLEVNVD